mgnify:CR=1 FL=1
MLEFNAGVVNEVPLAIGEVAFKELYHFIVPEPVAVNVDVGGLGALLGNNYGSSNVVQSINIVAQAWNRATQDPVSRDDVPKVY